MFAEIQIASQAIASVANLTFGLKGLTVGKVFQFGSRPSVITGIQVSPTTQTVVTTVPAPPSSISVATPDGQRALSDASIVRIELALDAMIVSKAELEENGIDEVIGLVTTLTLLFDFHISAIASGNQARMRFQYRDCDLGADLGAVDLADSIATEIYSKMTNHPMTISQPLGADAFSDLTLGSGFHMHNIGACMDAAENVIIIMMELDHPSGASFGHWSDFFTKNRPDRLGATNFALFIEKGLLVKKFEIAALKHLAKVEAEQDFFRDGVPKVTWRGDFPGARIEFFGQAIDLCPPVPPVIWEWLDLDLKATVDISFETQPDGSGLRVRAKIEGEATDVSEVVACITMFAYFWPVFGLPFLLSDGVDVEDPNLFYGGILLGPMAIATSLIYVVFGDISLVMDVGQIEQMVEVTKGEEYILDVDIKESLSFANIPKLGFELESVAGSSTGLQINGQVGLPVFARSARLNVNIPNSENEIPEFEWSYQGGCHGSPKFTAQFVLSVENLNLQDPLPRTPLEIGEVTILDDPLNQFGPHVSIEFPYIIVSLVEEDVLPTYEDDRYPCKLLIHTTGGARLITIPGIPEDPPNKGGMYIAFKTQQLIDCKKWTFAEFGKYHDLLWLVDPAPEDTLVDFAWTFAVTDAMPGSLVEIYSPTGEVVGSLEANRAGSARFTTLSRSDVAGSSMKFVLQAPSGFADQLRKSSASGSAGAMAHKSIRQAGKLRVTQTQYSRQSFVPLARPALGLATGRMQGQAALIAMFEDGFGVFNIDRPAAPRITHLRRAIGLCGAFAWGSGVVTWGEDGAAFHNLDDESDVAITSSRVRSAIRHNAHLLLLDDEGIEIYDGKLELESRLTGDGCDSLRSAGKYVELVGTNKRLMLPGRRAGCADVTIEEVSKGLSRSTRSCGCQGTAAAGGLEVYPGAVSMGDTVAYLTANGLGLVINRITRRLELSEEQMVRLRQGGRRNLDPNA